MSPAGSWAHRSSNQEVINEYLGKSDRYEKKVIIHIK
jgi:hypothetical protein